MTDDELLAEKERTSVKEEGILYASANGSLQYGQNYSREIEIDYKLPDWDGCGGLTEIVHRGTSRMMAIFCILTGV